MYAPNKENPYLNMTPMALRGSLQMVGLARSFAAREVDRLQEIISTYDTLTPDKTWLDAEYTLAFWQDLALFEQDDVELYETALRINACCIAYAAIKLD